MGPIAVKSGCRSLAVWGVLVGSAGLAASPAAGQGEWRVVDLRVENPAAISILSKTPGQATAIFLEPHSVLTVSVAADGSLANRRIDADDPSGYLRIRGLHSDGTLDGLEYFCDGDDRANSLLWVGLDGVKTRPLCGQISFALGSFSDGTVLATNRFGQTLFILATQDGGRTDVPFPEDWWQFVESLYVSDGGATGWFAGKTSKVLGDNTIVPFAWVWDRATGQFIHIDDLALGLPLGTEVRSGPISDSSMATGLVMPDPGDLETWRVWMWSDEDSDLNINAGEITDDLLSDQRPANSCLVPLSVNARGDILLSDSLGGDQLYLWSGGVLTPLASLLQADSEFVILRPNFNELAPQMTNEGWILCSAFNTVSGQFTAIVLMPPEPETDTDGDGLLDDWEENGIPYTGVDGVEKRYILPGADKNHKTLYVEIDTMPEVPFTIASKRLVERAFAQAPVANPDGTIGIDLFIQIDDPDLPTEPVSDTPGGHFPASTAVNKALFFGSAEERADPNRTPMLAAKARAFRYALGYRKASGKMGGLGELGGDDFVAFAEGYSDLDYASVFMHELGHNLNLNHGGTDDINRKPNYPSIMNYALTYRSGWNRRFWRLDFSREELSVLNEAALDERVSVGFGGSGYYRRWRTPWYGTPPIDSECYELGGVPAVFYASLDIVTRADFDLDCDTEDFNVTADLNYDAADNGSAPSPGEIMHGTDDWSFMTLAISPNGGAFAGGVPQDELTEADRDYINATFPDPEGICGADWNNDGAVNTLDVLGFLNDWVAVEYWADLNLDGQVNTLDVLLFLNEWASGC